MTQTIIVTLSVLGVIGQFLAAFLLVAGEAWVLGTRAPLAAIRNALWGYELWAAFAVTAIATGGSRFSFSTTARAPRTPVGSTRS